MGLTEVNNIGYFSCSCPAIIHYSLIKANLTGGHNVSFDVNVAIKAPQA